MDNEMALRRYCAQVRRNLPCGRKQKKRILKEIYSSGTQWLQQNPGGSFAEFEKAFGSPAEISAAYLEHMDASELMSKLSVRKKILMAFLVAVAVFLLLWAGGVAWAMIDYHNYTRGKVIEYPAIDEGTVSIK